MENKFNKGIAGAIIGAGLLVTLGYNPQDVDEVTGITFAEIQENPERDVYYIVDKNLLVEDFNSFTETAHEKDGSIRYSNDGEKAILKFDAGTVVRDVELGQPYTNEEILLYLNNPENGFVQDI